MSRPPASPGTGPLAPAHRLLTVLLLTQVTMVAFESMAVSTAMPAVAVDLAAVRSFGLAFALMLSGLLLGSVVAGLWCDRAGPLPSLLVGQTLFGIGGLVCGAAWSLPGLLCGRVLTGIGGGLLVVALYVAIGRAFPGSMHPKVFGWISAAWVLPAIVGPLVAGVLTEQASWRWVFWCVVPVAAVTTALSWARRHAFTAPVDDGHVAADASPPTGHGAAASRRVMLLGIGLAVAAGLLQWGSQHVRPFSPWPVAVAVLGLAGVALTAPRLVPDGTVRMARGLPSVMLARFLLTATFNGATPFVPLMLTAEHGLTSTQAGIVLTLGSIGWSVGSAIQSREQPVDRHRLLAAGSSLVAAGTVGLAAVSALGLWPWLATLGISVSGIGMGLAMSTNSVLGLELTPVRDHGRTSASLQLCDALGSALGVAVTGAIFAALHRQAGSDAAAYTLLWLACAGIGTVGWFAGERSRPLPPRP